jgi:hypothetical protein
MNILFCLIYNPFFRIFAYKNQQKLMKTFYARHFSSVPKNLQIKLFIAFFALLGQGGLAFGQVPMATTGTYTQSFDALPASGAVAWADNSTLQYWYTARSGTGANIAAGDGSSNAGNLYSFGTGTATERALGSIGSGSAGNFAYGLLLQNTAAVALTDMQVAYTLEQWRLGSTTANAATFWYKVISTPTVALTPNVNTGWTQVTGLTGTSPVITGTLGTLNGNLPANKTVIANVALTGISVPAGQYVLIKWDDMDHTGADQGLSVDDVTVSWTFGASCNTTSTITAAACDTYTLNANTYTTSGTYTQLRTNAAGCDSTITLNLTIKPSYEGPAAVTICTGDTYTFGTQSLTTAGTYTEVFERANGCDSTVHLTLAVISAFNETDAAAICAGETYTFGTQSLTLAGTYTELFQSQSGCDSTVNLTLTVNQPTSSTLTVHSCTPTYTYHSNVFTTAGTYPVVIENAAGCDSTVSLQLTFGAPSSHSFSEEVCGSYTWNTQTYTSSGTYIQIFENAQDCDSVVTLDLTVTAVPGMPVTSADTTYCGNETLVAMTAGGAVASAPLIISGIVDATLPGGLPKCVEVYVIEDIADLSIYSLAFSSNGDGPSATPDFTFPAVAATAGMHIRIATELPNFQSFFGIAADYASADFPLINGDDAIELFRSGEVIDVFGTVSEDGSGMPWEYTDGWAYRNTGSTPNSGVWNANEWTFSGVDVFEGQLTNATATPAFPIGTFTTSPADAEYTWYDDSELTNVIGTGATMMPSQTPGTTTYFVTQSVNGCESDGREVLVGIYPAPAVPVITANGPLAFCPGGNVVLTSSAANGNEWQNDATSQSITATTAGTYEVTVTDLEGCSSVSAPVTVTLNAAPVATITANNATLTAAPAGQTYQWINCTGNAPVAGATAATFTPVADGSYAVIVTNAGGCADTSACMAIDVLGIQENKTDVALSFFPNPTTGKVTFTMQGSAPVHVTVFNALGKVVSTMSDVTSGTVIDLGTAQNGVYMVQVTNENISKVFRIVKK